MCVWQLISGFDVATLRHFAHAARGTRRCSRRKSSASCRSCWRSRRRVIGLLEGMREHLEDLGGGLGLTDPVSGEVAVELKA